MTRPKSTASTNKTATTRSFRKEAVDAVLLLKIYHDVANPIALLKNLRGALRPGARVGIIDRNGNGANHGVSRKIVVEEAGEAGYRLLETYDLVKPDDMD